MHKPCKTKKCGCEDTGLTTPTPCIHDSFNCPNPEKCPETFSACCTIYTGDTIVDTGIVNGDNLCNILQILSLWATNPMAINPNSLCKPVINLATQAISTTTIKVGWLVSNTATTYQVEYKLASASTWTLNPIVSTGVDTIIGLTPDSFYQIRVKSICDVFVDSFTYSVTIQVKTNS